MRLASVRRQLEDVTVGIAEVHRQRVAVILVVERHTLCSKALLGGIEIVDDERDVPEPGRLGLTGGRFALCLEQTELHSRLTKKDGLVVLGRLIQLPETEHVAVPRDRTSAVGDVERYVVETPELHRAPPILQTVHGQLHAARKMGSSAEEGAHGPA